MSDATVEYILYNVHARINFTIHGKLSGKRGEIGLYTLEIPTNYRPFAVYSALDDYWLFNIRRQRDGWYMDDITHPIHDYVMQEAGPESVTTHYYGWDPDKYRGSRRRPRYGKSKPAKRDCSFEAVTNWMDRKFPYFEDTPGVPAGRENEFLERELNYNDWD